MDPFLILGIGCVLVLCGVLSWSPRKVLQQSNQDKKNTTQPESPFDWARKREEAILLKLRALAEWKNRLVGARIWSDLFEKRFAWVVRQTEDYLVLLTKDPQVAQAQHKLARFQPGVSVPVEPGIFCYYDGSKKVSGELEKLIYAMKICYCWHDLEHELECNQAAAEANRASEQSSKSDGLPLVDIEDVVRPRVQADENRR